MVANKIVKVVKPGTVYSVPSQKDIHDIALDLTGSDRKWQELADLIGLDIFNLPSSFVVPNLPQPQTVIEGIFRSNRANVSLDRLVKDRRKVSWIS